MLPSFPWLMHTGEMQVHFTTSEQSTRVYNIIIIKKENGATASQVVAAQSGPHTWLRSTMPRGLELELMSLLAKRKRKPCLSTNQRLRQVLMCSPWLCIHPAFSGWCQNSTWSAVSSYSGSVGA